MIQCQPTTKTSIDITSKGSKEVQWTKEEINKEGGARRGERKREVGLKRKE